MNFEKDLKILILEMRIRELIIEADILADYTMNDKLQLERRIKIKTIEKLQDQLFELNENFEKELKLPAILKKQNG